VSGSRSRLNAGCEENQARFRSRFDLVILLSAPARAMTERLTARSGNLYGKAPGDMGRILADLAAVEPLLWKATDHEIRTTIPLTDVMAKVLSLAGISPDGHHTPGPHAGRAPGMKAGTSQPRDLLALLGLGSRPFRRGAVSSGEGSPAAEGESAVTGYRPKRGSQHRCASCAA
jgi:hypothetical protein